MTELEVLREYLLEPPASSEERPFGPDVLVYKVAGRMFALLAWRDDPLRITLKCDPAQAQHLRRSFEAVRPGYYMNKEHWNTVLLDGSIDRELLRSWIDESYALVVSGLKKPLRESLRRRAGLED